MRHQEAVAQPGRASSAVDGSGNVVLVWVFGGFGVGLGNNVMSVHGLRLLPDLTVAP